MTGSESAFLAFGTAAGFFLRVGLGLLLEGRPVRRDCDKCGGRLTRRPQWNGNAMTWRCTECQHVLVIVPGRTP